MPSKYDPFLGGFRTKDAADALSVAEVAQLAVIAAAYVHIGAPKATPAETRQMIQDAIDNLSARFGGGLLDLGPYLYLVDYGLQARSNVRVRGQGKGITTIRLAGDTAVALGGSGNLLNNVFLAHRNNENLRGWGLYSLTLDGNRSAQATILAEDVAGSANDSVGNVVRASSSAGYLNSDWEIIDVECINGVYHGGIMVGTLTRGEVSRCSMTGNGYRGFHIHGDGVGLVTAITVGAVTSLTITGHRFVTGDQVTLKNFTGANANLLNGKTFAATKTGSNTITVPVNTAGQTITVAANTYAYGGDGAVGIITVHHNKCWANGVSTSVAGGAGILSGIFVVFDNAAEFQVTDNQIWNEPGFGLEADGATSPVAPSHFHIISRNTIRNCGQGMQIGSGLSQTILSHNIVNGSKVNATPGGSSSGHGINIAGITPVESLIIQGNVITHNAGYGLVYQDPGAVVHRDQIITANIISSNGGRGLHIVKCGDAAAGNNGALVLGNVVTRNIGDAQTSQFYLNTSYKCLVLGNMFDTAGAAGGNLPVYVGSATFKSAIINNLMRRNGGSSVIDMYAPLSNDVTVDGNVTDGEGIWPNGVQLQGGTINAVHAAGTVAPPAMGNVPAGVTVTFGGWERVKFMDATGALSNGIVPVYKAA